MKKFLLIFCLIGFAATIAPAQSYTDVVWRQIQDAYDNASDDGYSVKNYILGAIDEGEDNTWTFYLSSSWDYKIQAFCDNDCDDIDLYLKDSDGDVIDEDTLEDDYPVVFFSPYKSGTYQIDITMYSCAVEPCYFGLAIFNK